MKIYWLKIIVFVLLVWQFETPQVFAQQEEFVTIYNGTTGSVAQGTLIDGRRHGQWLIFNRKPVKSHQASLLTQPSSERVSEKVLKKHFLMQTPYQVVHYTHGILNGEFTEYYPNGTIQFSAQLQSGKLDGPYKAFHEDGSLRIEGAFRQDQPHQEWRRFFASGVQESLEFYYNGLKVGDWKWFHANGEVRETISFIQDKKDGSYQSFFPNGQLEEQGTFDKNEKVGSWQTYFDNGQLASQSNFSFGMPDGAWEYYGIDGALVAGGSYSLGKKLGTWIEQTDFDSGLRRKGFYLDDVKTGTWQVINEDGHIFQEEVYKDNKLIAVSNFVKVDGDTLSAGNLANGQGERIFFDMEGRVVKKGLFADGNPHGVWQFFDGESSNLQKLGGFLEGNMHGEWLTYDASGKVVERAYYEYGELLPDAVLNQTSSSTQGIPSLTNSPTLDSNTAMHRQGTKNLQQMFYSSQHGAN